MSRAKILFQLSGSIACFKACEVVSKLAQNGFEVRTACTRSALEFIGRATLEGLTGNPVFADAFEQGRVMDHIHLAKWADLAIVCPATANTINKLSHGIADDALGSLFLAYDRAKPYLIAPAMNQQMWRHPSVRDSIHKLSSWGVKVLPTDNGRQACGDVGEGRLLGPDAIYQAIGEALSP